MSEKEFLHQLEENKGIIYKLVSLYAVDNEEKRDLYQEILLQAWKYYDQFRGEAKFSTWLYRVSLNTILTQKRKKTLIEYKDTMEAYGNMAYAEPDVHKGLNSLQLAIRKLQETERAMISLHLDGYSNNEIGGVMGITANHVAVKLHRVKQQLSNLLKKEV